MRAVRAQQRVCGRRLALVHALRGGAPRARGVGAVLAVPVCAHVCRGKRIELPLVRRRAAARGGALRAVCAVERDLIWRRSRALRVVPEGLVPHAQARCVLLLPARLGLCRRRLPPL